MFKVGVSEELEHVVHTTIEIMKYLVGASNRSKDILRIPELFL
jgi:hypothetical protein